MKTHPAILALLLTVACFATTYFADPLAAGPVTTLADIDFWVGQGQNEAALVVDFDDMDAASPALVWGYRFDGSPTAEMMFRDVAAADARLFAKINSFSFGNFINGIGYDANDDGMFAIDDGTVFDADGIAETASSDGAMAVDPADLYREGFFTDGFWNLGTADSSPFDGGAWASAMAGISDQMLSDEMFVGLTFDADFSSFSGPGDFPQNPQAAAPPGGAQGVPEPSSLVGMLLCALVAICSYRLTRRRRAVA